jgi:hypothetical protein
MSSERVTVCEACSTSVTHKQNFNALHKCEKEGKPSGKTCPKCNSATVFKTGKWGTFHGCPRFPVCRGVVRAKRGVHATKPGEVETDEAGDVGDETDETPTVEAKAGATPIPALPDTADPLGKALWGSLGPVVQAYVQSEARRIAQETVATSGKVAKVVWTLPDGTVKCEIEGGHKDIPRIAELIRLGFKNIMLVGPAGSGKTRACIDVAKMLKRDFVLIPCTEETTISEFAGEVTHNLTAGERKYQRTPWVNGFAEGKLLIADEIDNLSANVACGLNAQLANDMIQAKVTGEVIQRHPDTVIVVTGNTYGTGPNRAYVGRNQLDAATLNRFTGAVLTVDYDRDLEQSLVGGDAKVCAAVWKIREKVAELSIRRIVGTRDLMAVKRHVAGGKSVKDALGSVFGPDAGWSKEEIARVGI